MRRQRVPYSERRTPAIRRLFLLLLLLYALRHNHSIRSRLQLFKVTQQAGEERESHNHAPELHSLSRENFARGRRVVGTISGVLGWRGAADGLYQHLYKALSSPEPRLKVTWFYFGGFFFFFSGFKFYQEAGIWKRNPKMFSHLPFPIIFLRLLYADFQNMTSKTKLLQMYVMFDI